MGRKKKKPYFGDEEEQAVIDYIYCDDYEEKNDIYNRYLRKPFRMMSETILRKYNNHIGNYDIHEIEINGLSHLIENVHKFKQFVIEFKKEEDEKWEKSKKFKYRTHEHGDAIQKLDELNNTEDGYEYRLIKAKAFSYCGTIIRNYYKDHSKKSFKEITEKGLSFEDYVHEIENKVEYTYNIDDEPHTELELLIFDIVDSIQNQLDNNHELKKDEILVGEGIVELLSNWDILFLEETPKGQYEKKVTNKYQKNKILFLLKELTRLETKDIRLGMMPYKELYPLIKKEFFANLEKEE